MPQNYNCIAIIPARGGSKGIPRKNVRLINGKPLIAYSIEAARRAKCFSEVIVSTDDEEIGFIAQKYGAYVLPRPPELATDHIGLDQVIAQAVTSYEKTKNRLIHFVATIQATVPLLTPQTIEKTLKKCMEENLDTVLTVSNDTHLSWKLNQNKSLVPEYEKRVNRQFLPQRFRETGGIVVCKREILSSGTRFGKNVGIVECDKKEAIDIDDHFDWWLVEKQLKRKKIAFRVEGYEEIGLGHIYRGLTLADNMIDHDIAFIISKRSGLGAGIIRSRFYPVIEFEPTIKDEIATIESFKPDIVVNDILDTKKGYIKLLKKNKCRVVNFEDLGKGAMEADAVINDMYSEPSGNKHSHIHTGYKYICLRDEFYSAKPITVKKNVDNILILFGGTDPSDLTKKTLQWLTNIPKKFSITVVIGSGYKNPNTIRALIAGINSHRVELISDTKIMTRYMEKTDIAITSAGRTVFELTSLGIPMIVLCQNKREQLHTFAKNEFGVINLGLGKGLTFKTFQNNVLNLLNSKRLRKKMHDSLLKFNFKNGTHRVWEIILNQKSA